MIRTGGSGAERIEPLRRIAVQEFPSLPLAPLRTLAQQETETRSELMVASGAAALAGLLILVLASVGLYGVVAFAVAQRTREIGIRFALGSAASRVVARFLASGAILGGIGLP